MSATFSEDRVYRYSLMRIWDSSLPRIAFIGLNPSTADETKDDPTIRRCIGFAKRWGYGSLVMLNLFAFRATDPQKLEKISDPIGPDNWATILAHAASCHRMVAAWGTYGSLLNMGNEIRCSLPYDLWHLGLTKDGYPKHPLYLKADTEPVLWKR